MKKLIIILGMCATTMSMTAQAQDTITFTWKGGINKSFALRTFAMGQYYVVDWGDTCVETNPLIIIHSYADTNNYSVKIIGYDTMDHLPWLWSFFDCSGRQLSSLNFSATVSFATVYGGYLYCNNNLLPLSDLYTASGAGSATNNKRLGPQFLSMQQIVVGDTIDFSSQAKFNNIATVFVVEKGYMGGTKAVLDVDYTFKNEIMAFKNTGTYFVNMTNAAIKSDPNYPAIVYAEFNVVEPPNTDATLANLTVSEGVLNPIFDCYTFNYAVDVANNISKITISAVPTDTNATISGDIGLQQLKTGMNIFTIIVTAEDGKTKFNYTVAVNRSVGIEKITQEQLIISSIEIYDMLGRNLTASLRGTQCRSNPEKTSPNPSKTSAPLSFQGGEQLPPFGGTEGGFWGEALPAGIYIVKIYTDKGVIIKKIVK